MPYQKGIYLILRACHASGIRFNTRYTLWKPILKSNNSKDLEANEPKALSMREPKLSIVTYVLYKGIYPIFWT